MLNDYLKVKFSDKPFKILVYLGATFFVILSVLSFVDAKNWVGTRFPGFLIYSNLMVAEEALSDWTGAQHGLKAFDQITEVNGQKVYSSQEVYDIALHEPLNQPIDYTVIRGGGFLKISIPTMDFTLGDLFLLFGPTALIGAVFFLIGLVVYYLKPNLVRSKVFFLFCYCISIWFISLIDSHTTYFVDVESKVWIFVPAFFILLALTIPSENRLFKRRSSFIKFVAFSVSILLFIIQLIYYNSHNVWGKLSKSVWVYLLISTLFLITSLLITYLKPTSRLDKQRAQIILLGALLGFVIPALGAVTAVLFHLSNITYMSIPVIIFPLSIGYAIAKHKLFDIDVIIRKTLVYGTLTAVMVGVFALMVMLFNIAFFNYGDWKNPAFFALTSVLLVAVLNPVKSRIQNIIDLTFFRRKYDYRNTIEEISYAMTSLLNLNEIIDRLLNTVEQTMFSSPVYVILFDRDSELYRVCKAGGSCDSLDGVTVEEDSVLIQLLYKYRREIFIEDVFADEKFILRKDELIKVFEHLNAALFIPMFFKEQLIGVLSVGEKKSGLLYTSEDMKLLKILTNQSAIAIENAIAFKLVEDYVNKLEDANKELIETQTQLIRAAKMSAIGQLAAGIAHEIRNPLNIIEGSRYYLAQMIKGEDSSVMGEYLEYIKHEVQRTNRLIDTLLQLSKSDPPNFEEIDVKYILENSFILMRKQFSDNNIKLVKNLSCNLPNIVGDPNQIWQVFVNIIINSIQALPNGGEIRIDAGLCKESSDNIYISFTDTGMGISKESLQHIFNPFFTTKNSGTGLGLSICNRIVDEHQGRILVSSEEGKGSTFIVEFPVNPKINTE